ncbi:MAG TPA: hypothetical protein VGG74_24655 [Kofleriaceae bacterium]
MMIVAVTSAAEAVDAIKLINRGAIDGAIYVEDRRGGGCEIRTYGATSEVIAYLEGLIQRTAASSDWALVDGARLIARGQA